MKLTISRSQLKTQPGVVTFKLGAQVEFTEDELELIFKYRAQAEAVLADELDMTYTSVELESDIDALLNGSVFNSTSYEEIKDAEEALIRACEALKQRLLDMQSFGGEDTYEF